jgi:hypothetical protein
MSIPSPWSKVLDLFGTPLVIERSPGQLSGDAGLLPVRRFDQRFGLTCSIAEALDDPRDAAEQAALRPLGCVRGSDIELPFLLSVTVFGVGFRRVTAIWRNSPGGRRRATQGAERARATPLNHLRQKWRDFWRNHPPTGGTPSDV